MLFRSLPISGLRALAAGFGGFFQAQKRWIVLVIANAKFFPVVYPVQLFPQHLITDVVKIQAADRICSVGLCVGVGGEDRTQAWFQFYMVSIIDEMLPFVPELLLATLLSGTLSHLWRGSLSFYPMGRFNLLFTIEYRIRLK